MSKANKLRLEGAELNSRNGTRVKHILAAVDGTDNVLAEVEVASEIVKVTNAELTILYDVAVPSPAYSGDMFIPPR